MRSKVLFRRRKLPHWDIPGATYFITTCLEGSIPAQGFAELEQYRKGLESLAKPIAIDEEAWDIQKQKMLFARFDRLIDLQPGVRHLESQKLASEVRESLYFFAGQRYDLYCYVIMPSHIHWVFRPKEEWVKEVMPDGKERSPREIILHSVNLHSARECNRLLGRKGTFWQDESYGHCVRDGGEFVRIIEYVEGNPVKAHLVESPEQWDFSSARDRKELGIPWGEPLVLE
ncbi:MAG: hypothetical protein HYU36_01925 [Planctomycetes bacterium]|nr:hypothetical protein [Planctomycetota bacterium]